MPDNFKWQSSKECQLIDDEYATSKCIIENIKVCGIALQKIIQIFKLAQHALKYYGIELVQKRSGHKRENE